MADGRIGILTQALKAAGQHIFSDNLTGIYLHGSLAFGCFRWEVSDLDFLVVTETEPELRQKERWIRKLLEVRGISPPRGLEMSIVLAEHCRNLRYPTPYELHFSKLYERDCRTDLAGYCEEMNGRDWDLAAHFMVIREVGLTLCGEEKEKVFGEVPHAVYWDSIRRDVADSEEWIVKVPVPVILNLCRVLAYAEEGLVLSKVQGGAWGLAHLPACYEELIRSARASYEEGTVFEGACEQELLVFAREMLRHIRT